jgi:Conserved TM helix
MTTSTVYDWGQAIMTSVAAALALFLGAIPKIIGFLAILIIGWLIAGALAGVVANLLRAVKFNELAERSGFSGFVRNMGVHTDAADVLATAVRWFIRLIVLVVAFDALGLPAVSQVLQQLLLWIPNLIVALMVLVIAGLAANALYRLVRGATAEAGLGNPDLLANIARVAVWAFAIVVAVNQIGIASTLVNTLFMGVVAALALSFGLAFGLGGRDTAGEIVRSWYHGAQRDAPKLAHAADAAGDQAQAAASEYQATAADRPPSVVR